MLDLSESECDYIEQLHEMFSNHIRAHQDLGLILEEVDGPIVKLQLPYQEKYSDSLENGSLHSSAIATAIDGALGYAVMRHLGRPTSIATVNLRVDHINKPEPGMSVVIHANCSQHTESFMYVDAEVFQTGSSVICSKAIGIFKTNTPGPALGIEL